MLRIRPDLPHFYWEINLQGKYPVSVPAYRGFKRKGAHVLGHNIIVAPNLRYGLKRRSGTFGSISDLNEGLVH